MSRLLIFPFLLSFFWNFEQPTKVPDTTIFCGIEITIDESAKEKIRDIKKKLYENPTYFNAAVDRGDTYLPFIEEALRDLNVPDDIKYVAMQESNLFPAAVSTSNAVGFWQFKEDAAKESGLVVNAFIDQRKHVYLSSLAAASYFAKANRTYDNWLYSIISYYEGVTGVVDYTDPKYYGKKQMTIDDKTHWYLLKSIAYKLTYEDALKLTYQPTVWLQPVSVTGPSTNKEIGDKYGVTPEKVGEWNKWISNNQIPAGEIHTVYIPHYNESYRGHTVDPNKAKAMTVLVTNKKMVEVKVPQTAKVEVPANPPATTTKPIENTTSDVPPSPQIGEGGGAVSVKELPQEMYAAIDIKDDLYYGEGALALGAKPEYVLYDGTQKLQDIALTFRLRYTDLLLWNDFMVNQEPSKGSIIYLKKISKVRFHIVRPGETLSQIAQKHFTSIENIQKKNRMAPNEYRIYFGQRLYLKDARPKNEKIIILTHSTLKNLSAFAKSAYKTESSILPAPPSEDPFALIPMPKKEEQMAAKAIDVAKPAEATKFIEVELPPITVMKEVIDSIEVPVIPTNQKSQWLVHQVAAGETLWNIAQKYRTRVEVIRKINELGADALSPGKALKIFMTLPEISDEDRSKGVVYHTVLGGEIVDKIAMRYNTTSDTIIKLNNLLSTSPKMGSMLKIPVK